MPNIHDVARRAGVSPVTVSRVVNGAPNVHSDTRARVELAIRELGYLPNLAARSLRARQTRTLALIVPDITNAFWTTVARGVEDAAQSGGYSVLLCNTDENPDKQSAYLETVLRQRVDGVILAPCDADLARLARLPEQNTPAVLVDRRVPGWTGDTVGCDSLAAARALTAHLIALGRRQIAVISGPVGASTADDRISGYKLALLEAGLPFNPGLVRRGEYRARSGREMAGLLLDEGRRPDAFLAANNVLAMGVLEALHERGLRIPQDTALVCFDDLPDLAQFYPFLSVAAQPAYDIGLNAAQLLLSRIDASGPLQPRRVVLPVRLVLRYSCGRFLGQEAQQPGNSTLLSDRTETRLVPPRAGEPAREAPSGLGQALRPDAATAARRMAYLELDFPGRAVLEYALQRSLGPAVNGWSVAPADWVSAARRIGVDALPCGLYPPEMGELPALSALLNRLEGYLRAAQGSGVGVYPLFCLPHWAWQAAALKRVREQVRVIVDRFHGDLAMVMFGLGSAAVEMAGALPGLLAPLKEHGLLSAVRLPAENKTLLEEVLAGGADLAAVDGWDALREPAESQAHRGRLMAAGGIDGAWLARTDRAGVRSAVWQQCAALAEGGNYVFAPNLAGGPDAPPEVYIEMVRAVREFSR